MQQHAERLAESVADEPDDGARIEKVYRKLFGRAPTADEVKAGREFLQAEAFKQYEDRKAEGAKAASAKKDPDAGDKGEPTPEEPAAESEDMPKPDGMMVGVKPDAKPSAADKEKMLPVSTFGRYLKILLSSNEFIFVS
jgi:hypothetical protein